METNGINISTSDNNEIMDLTNQLIKAHEKLDIQNIKIQELNEKLNGYDSTINNYKNIIKQKEEELNKLKSQLKNISKPKESNPKIYQKEMVCVNFLSEDQNIHFALPCSKNNIFAEVEEKLYQQYPEYRNTNNNFIANGAQILRFKTIAENKIGSGFPVILVAPS